MGYKRLSAAEKFKTLPDKYTRNMFSWNLDWRSPIGQRVMAEVLTLAQDLGGWDTLSRSRQILVEKVVFMHLRTSEYESDQMQGKTPEFDDGSYSNLASVMKGYLNTLGLDRVAVPARTLAEYQRGAA